MDHTRDVTVSASHLEGAVLVPSSKSHTIRALLIAAGATGISHIENALDSADARSCIAAIRTLGVSVDETARTSTGLSLALTPPEGGAFGSPAGDAALRIDVGNSGTTLFLLAAMAALRRGETTFDGDDSIRGRDAEPLLNALRALGADVHGGPFAPFSVRGPLRAGASVEIACPTSQYLSALLLAAPLIPAAPPRETVLVPTVLYERPYVDMTCWWLDQQDISYRREEYRRFAVAPGQRYNPVRTTLPGDYSSATFWFAAAALTGGSVTVEGLAPDDVQGDRGVLDILAAMGATVAWNREGECAPAVTVRGPLQRGGFFDLNAMPDALPALAAAACYAPEPVTLGNVPQARSKETDRIAVMARVLNTLGAETEELPDGLVIRPSALAGGTVESHGDHRIAMALAIAALGASGPVRIRDAGAAAVTYPSFFTELRRLAPGAMKSPEVESET